MRRLLHALLLAALPAASAAQDTPEVAEDGTARRYAVEVIIFAYKELDSVGTETFVPEPVIAADVIPAFGDSSVTATVAEETLPDPRYRILAADELELLDTWRMLSRLQAYVPLMHFGWVQETVPDVTMPPLALERFGNPPERLQGTVSLNLSRFLHLGVDLSLAADEAYPVSARAVPDDAGAGHPAGTMAFGDDTALYAPLRYQLEETRIMRSGETRYYDHPHFGVIARVTRVEEEGTPAGGL